MKLSWSSLFAQLLTAIVLGGTFYFTLKPSKTCFIDNTKVLAHYVKAKGYDQVLESKRKQMEQDIDAAAQYLNSIQGSKVAIDTARASKEMARVNQLQQQFQQHLQAEDQRISAQVGKELNALIKHYAEDNELNILFGATGDGNILYAEEQIDKTAELIAYIDETIGE